MPYQTVCGHCPYTGGCRYDAGGVSVAEIAYWAAYRRQADRLMVLHPHLSVEQMREALERFIACPGHPVSGPGWPRPATLLAVA